MGLAQELEYEISAEAADSSSIVNEAETQDIDGTLAGNKRPIYTEGDTGPTDDTDEQKELKRLYKLSGESVDDDKDPESDDKERKHQISAMKIPDYTSQKALSSPSSNVMKASALENKDYKASSLNMEPQAALKSAGYVCAPGSKGACATCPVYSSMAKMSRAFEPNVGKELFKGAATYTQNRLI